MDRGPRRLGRLFAEDARDTRHLARAKLPAKAPAVSYRYFWNLGARLNQGDTGTCVAHGCVHLAENSPITRPGTLDPFELYRELILQDEWPENDWEAQAPNDQLQFGSSVRAGMKALQARGLISEYLWAWDLATAVDWVHRAGPLVIGVNWYEGMFETDARGFVRVTGAFAGGHALVLDGVHLTREYFRGLNSWEDWGRARKGTFLISFADFERLLGEDGECAMATEIVNTDRVL